MLRPRRRVPVQLPLLTRRSRCLPPHHHERNASDDGRRSSASASQWTIQTRDLAHQGHAEAEAAAVSVHHNLRQLQSSCSSCWRGGGRLAKLSAKQQQQADDSPEHGDHGHSASAHPRPHVLCQTHLLNAGPSCRQQLKQLLLDPQQPEAGLQQLLSQISTLLPGLCPGPQPDVPRPRSAAAGSVPGESAADLSTEPETPPVASAAVGGREHPQLQPQLRGCGLVGCAP